MTASLLIFRQGVTALLLSVCTPLLAQVASGANDMYQDNLVVILDASGSMNDPLKKGGETKMPAARRALKSVLSKLPATTNVGVLVFGGTDANGRTLKEDWVYPLGPMDESSLARAIDRPQPKGKTWLGKYLKLGADRLLEQRKQQRGYGTYRLLVVTDGEANDAAKVEKHVPDILSRGITVDVIGVDMKKTHTLATRVHSYRQVNDSASLEKALSEVLAEIGSQDVNATEEAFELLQGFPADIAMSVIGALTEVDDRPIGQVQRTPQPVRSEGMRKDTPNGNVHFHPGAPVSETVHYGAPRKTFFQKFLKAIGLGLALFVIGVIFAVIRQRRYR